MAIDLSNGNGEYWRFGHPAWAELLKLAYEYGWRPLGTVQDGYLYGDNSEDESWNGNNYVTNDGQLIPAEDASAIAGALEKAFEDVLAHHQLGWGEELVDYFRAGALRIF
jgi:hypothetical protein